MKDRYGLFYKMYFTPRERHLGPHSLPLTLNLFTLIKLTKNRLEVAKSKERNEKKRKIVTGDRGFPGRGT